MACFRGGSHGRPAQSNDHPHAVSTEELRAQVQRGLDTNAVEDQTSDLLYPLGRVRGVAMVHDVVRTERLAVLEFLLIDVSGDDADGASTRRS